MPEQSGTLLARQFAALARLSLARYWRSRHARLVLSLALLPVVAALVVCGGYMLASGFAFTDPLEWTSGFKLRGEGRQATEALLTFRRIFEATFLHFGVYFAALSFAGSVMREEVDEQTLHYLYLQPIARPLIVAGKYAGYLLMVVPIYLVALLLVQFLCILPFGAGGLRSFLSSGGIGSFASQSLVIGLALIQYTSLFLLSASLVRGPMFGLVFFAWERAAGYLPEAMQRFSLRYYLQDLLPASGRDGGSLFGVVVEGPSALARVLVLVLVPIVCLAVASWLGGRRECIYSES